MRSLERLRLELFRKLSLGKLLGPEEDVVNAVLALAVLGIEEVRKFVTIRHAILDTLNEPIIVVVQCKPKDWSRPCCSSWPIFRLVDFLFLQ